MKIFLLRHPVPGFHDLLHGIRDPEPLLKIDRRFRKAHAVHVSLKPFIQGDPEPFQILHIDPGPDPHGIHQRPVQIEDHRLHAGKHVRRQRRKGGKLFLRKRAEFSCPKALIQRKRPHGDPSQISHAASDGLHHPLDLMVLSFRNGQKIRRGRIRSAALQALRLPELRRSAAFSFPDVNALPQAFTVPCGKRSVRLHIVGLLHMSGRRKQPVGERSVVCHQKQPLRILIQPSRRKKLSF